MDFLKYKSNHFCSYLDHKALLDDLKAAGPEETIHISEQVVQFIQERTPTGTAYETLLFYLRRGQFVFVITNLGEEMYFPRLTRKRTLDIRFYDSTLLSDDLTPVYAINVTKKFYDCHLGNTEAKALLIFHYFVENFLPPPYKKSRHDLAVEKEDMFIQPTKIGLHLSNELEQKISKSTACGDQDFLFSTIDQYDIRKDPDGVLAQAVYQALDHISSFRITENWQFSAWYRYMLEHVFRDSGSCHPSLVLREISKNIIEGVQSGWISPELIFCAAKTNKMDLNNWSYEDFNEYSVFAFSDPDYCGGALLLIPQAPIDLEDSSVSNLFSSENADKKVLVKSLLDRVQRILCERRSDCDFRAVTIGVVGPAASGKTTLARSIRDEAENLGIKTSFFEADEFTHKGEGFRYDSDSDGMRVTNLSGPGIYDEIGLDRILNHLKNGGEYHLKQESSKDQPDKRLGPDSELVVTDGVFLGLDQDLSETIDLLIALPDYISSKSRLEIKSIRDSRTNTSHKGIDIPRDFSEKQFHEVKDALRPLILERADYVWQREISKLYVRLTI